MFIYISYMSLCMKMSYDTATHSIMRLFLKVVSRSGRETSYTLRFLKNAVLDMNSLTKQSLIRMYVFCFAHIKYLLVQLVTTPRLLYINAVMVRLLGCLNIFCMASWLGPGVASIPFALSYFRVPLHRFFAARRGRPLPLRKVY